MSRNPHNVGIQRNLIEYRLSLSFIWNLVDKLFCRIMVRDEGGGSDSKQTLEVTSSAYAHGGINLASLKCFGANTC